MKVLALNSNFIPIRLCSKFATIGKFYTGAVVGMLITGDKWREVKWDEWLELSKKDIWPKEQEFIQAVTQRIAIPEVIRYLNYGKIPKVSFRLSRQSIYNRDDYTCYLCGEQYSEGKLSIDHIVPLSRGGRNSWENMATCCKRCNWDKGDKTLAELKIRPKYMPQKPVLSNAAKLRASVTTYNPNWKLFWF